MKLLNAITLAASVCERKASLPILGTLKLDANSITATNLDQQIVVPADLKKAMGKSVACVNAARVARVLKVLPADTEIDIKISKDARLFIRAGAVRFELKTLPPEDFPLFAAAGEEDIELNGMPAKPLRDALAFCAPAMATQDIRYYLNGMHFAAGKGRIIFDATDGHRLHRASVALDVHPDIKARSGILPRGVIAPLIEVLSEHDDVSISFGDRSFSLDADQTLTTKLVDGKFPDSTKVIPAARAVNVSIARAPLLEAVKRVSQVFAGGDKLTAVALTTGTTGEPLNNHAIEVSAENSEGETASETVECTRPDGGAHKFRDTYSWEYLRDALAAFDGRDVFLHLGQHGESLYLTDNDDGSRCAVIMPLRT